MCKSLLLNASTLIEKLNPLQKNGEHRLFIIDDTVEAKGGKHIEGSCCYICSNNKEQRTINAPNIVSINADISKSLDKKVLF